MSDAIVTHDLTKTYGPARGIRNVNLAVRQGEIFGFLGPNGAGKSTTLRTVMGLASDKGTTAGHPMTELFVGGVD